MSLFVLDLDTAAVEVKANSHWLLRQKFSHQEQKINPWSTSSSQQHAGENNHTATVVITRKEIFLGMKESGCLSELLHIAFWS